ncbi:MAG: DUF3261 domain-containing protein [Sphaerochaetaceae bacterium]|nr:DUF3261 domain-containing protein [Spirochaetales bacterium]MDY5499109.1 DUF3261 domain-containing protein [Sphaerochaetaceae bacterium]
MNHRLLSALLFSMILLLAGCVSTRQAGKVYVTDGAQVALLPTNDMEGTVDAMHLLAGSYKDRSFNLNAYVCADSGMISVTVMTTMGNTIATLSYEGESITKATSAINGVPFPAEYFFFDFQFCFYRADALKELFDAAGLSFTEEEKDGVIRRTLTDGSRVVATVDKSEAGISFSNQLRGYSYTIVVVPDA